MSFRQDHILVQTVTMMYCAIMYLILGKKHTLEARDKYITITLQVIRIMNMIRLQKKRGHMAMCNTLVHTIIVEKLLKKQDL